MRDQSKETNEEITSDLTNKTKDTRQDFRDDLNASQGGEKGIKTEREEDPRQLGGQNTQIVLESD